MLIIENIFFKKSKFGTRWSKMKQKRPFLGIRDLIGELKRPLDD